MRFAWSRSNERISDPRDYSGMWVSKKVRVGEGGYHLASDNSGESLRRKDFEQLTKDHLWA